MGTNHNTTVSAQLFLETVCGTVPSSQNFPGFHLVLCSAPTTASIPQFYTFISSMSMNYFNSVL